MANQKPNEVLQWHSILWGKSHGYRYYNLEGIDQEAAHAKLNNEPIPVEYNYTVSHLLGNEYEIYKKLHNDLRKK